mmetsp:Transcript_2142/g.6188  ORF Transcript_2142/g.6188 Transcript_2142/m.6188 type:complete len:438 (+) Transcript_2142:365-1678(+)
MHVRLVVLALCIHWLHLQLSGDLAGLRAGAGLDVLRGGAAVRAGSGRDAALAVAFRLAAVRGGPSDVRSVVRRHRVVRHHAREVHGLGAHVARLDEGHEVPRVAAFPLGRLVPLVLRLREAHAGEGGRGRVGRLRLRSHLLLLAVVDGVPTGILGVEHAAERLRRLDGRHVGLRRGHGGELLPREVAGLLLVRRHVCGRRAARGRHRGGGGLQALRCIVRAYHVALGVLGVEHAADAHLHRLVVLRAVDGEHAVAGQLAVAGELGILGALGLHLPGEGARAVESGSGRRHASGNGGRVSVGVVGRAAHGAAAVASERVVAEEGAHAVLGGWIVRARVVRFLGGTARSQAAVGGGPRSGLRGRRGRRRREGRRRRQLVAAVVGDVGATVALVKALVVTEEAEHGWCGGERGEGAGAEGQRVQRGNSASAGARKASESA